MKKIQEEIMAIAAEKGWGTTVEEISTPEKFALIHSEVSEAYEAYRKKHIDGPHGMEDELADIIIRVIHLAGCHGIDIDQKVCDVIQKLHGREWQWKDLQESHV